MADTEEIIKCPACGSEMTKIFIADKGINIDVCSNGCGGIFFDNKEIQEFSGENDNISEIKQALAGKNFMPVDENQTRICPACGTPMTKTRALGIQIDTCYKCGGLFLDNGEFELVRSKFPKKPKVKPVEYNPNSDINMEEFYKDTQDEVAELEGTSYYWYSKMRRRGIVKSIAKRDLVGLLFNLFW